ncbi:MAG: ribonuclease Y [bacterium]
MISTWMLYLFVGTVIGFILGWFLRQHLGQARIAKATEYADRLIEEAKTESENLKQAKLLEFKDEMFKTKQEFERESKSKLNEIHRLEKQLSIREINLDRKVDILNKKEQEVNLLNKELSSKSQALNKREEELERLIQEENLRLEQISGLTTEEAKKIQMQNMLEKAKKEAALQIREIREQAKQRASREAREIILQALQRSAIDQVVETTVSIVNLPDDEMKGRIIGREGRNIRTFESATGIEVLIDDTPQTVILSGFDPLRREIAKVALEKLISDGRIHPGRIEEVVAKTRDEINEQILELGEQALLDIGIHGLHPELVRLLGKQYYRTTYGQNLLQHSKEVSILAGGMAAQLGLDITMAKRAGLLHDIGKTADDYSDAPPHEIGVELAKKFGEGEIVQNAIAGQAPTNDINIISPISVLVQIADAVSVSRPGAQKEMLQNYIKRMKKLEDSANSFAGVLRSYAIQAGREIRVMVEHNIIDDVQAEILSENIAQKIQEELEYPGQIKVTVIREYRSIDYAK